MKLQSIFWSDLRFIRYRKDTLFLYGVPCLLFQIIRPGFPSFQPIQVLYQNKFLPFFLAPWSPPFKVNESLNLAWLAWWIAGIVIVWRTFDRSRLFAVQIYFVWISIGIVRCSIAFVLTRSLGWSAPRFFSHSSAYERSEGLGPLLVASNVSMSKKGGFLDHSAMIFIFVILQNAPWTYSAASIISCFIGAIDGFYSLFSRFSRFDPVKSVVYDNIMLQNDLHSTESGANTSDALPHFTIKRGSNGQEENDSVRKTKQLANSPSIRLCALVVIRLMICVLVGSILRYMNHTLPNFASLPPCLSGICEEDNRLMVEMIILSSPRPNEETNMDNSILSQTIESYTQYFGLPFIHLSVLSGSEEDQHPIFKKAKQKFVQVEFDVNVGYDSNLQKQRNSGHHRDLAASFLWFLKRSKAQWLMIIEDDFPLCGRWGWKGLEGILTRLESGRRFAVSQNQDQRFIRAAWIGTGGSGFILHRSIVEINAGLLNMMADMPKEERIPADLLLQGCISEKYDFCQKDHFGLLISDRMLMHHIGAGKSSLGHDVGADKYACGWRQPAHGQSYVGQVLEV